MRQAVGISPAACLFLFGEPSTMRPINKPLLRLAIAIHTRLVSQHLRETALDLPSHSWQGCTDLARQIRRAQLRGWHSAANALSRDLTYSVQSVQRELTVLEQRLIPARRPLTMSSRELYK